MNWHKYQFSNLGPSRVRIPTRVKIHLIINVGKIWIYIRYCRIRIILFLYTFFLGRGNGFENLKFFFSGFNEKEKATGSSLFLFICLIFFSFSFLPYYFIPLTYFHCHNKYRTAVIFWQHHKPFCYLGMMPTKVAPSNLAASNLVSQKTNPLKLQSAKGFASWVE